MAIVAMKHLRLIALREDREELLKKLQRLGCVEISRAEAPENAPPWITSDREENHTAALLREERTALESAIATLQRFVPAKKGLFNPAPDVSEAQLFDKASYEQALSSAKRLAECERELASVRAKRVGLREQQAQLNPWKDIDVPLDTPSTRCVSVIFGSVSLSSRWEIFTAEADVAAEGLTAFYKAGQDKERQYFLLLCHKNAEGAALQALKPYGYARVNLRNRTGTAASNLLALEKELTELDKAEKSVEGEITALADTRERLELALDRVAQELNRAEACDRLLDTDRTCLLEGWFPAESEEKLTALLKGYTAAWEMSVPTEEEYPDVPVKLKNNKLTAPFKVITEMYSMPAYDGIDPNPLMAPFFVFFFGFMMNDIGYGLLMVLGTSLFLWKAKPRGTMKLMMTMFLMCGFTSIFWGCLTGSFFGDFFSKLFALLGISDDFVWFWTPLFTPINDIIMVMVGSIILGVIQVFTGMGISFVYKCKHGDALGALLEEGAWWVIIGGAALAILGIGSVGGVPVVLIVGLLMLLAGNARTNKGFGIITGFGGALYNGISGYFSDILSYLRLMALMMAGSIIASVFNTLGSVFGLVPFIIVALIGNTLNLILNLLGCYVHTLRLQCLEFFGRFYKDGGKAFRPLAVETQYVNILKEEM